MDTFETRLSVKWPLPTRAAAAWLAKLVRWPATDYAAWVALGPGRIQHGVSGWLAVTALRSAIGLRGRRMAVGARGPVSPSLTDLPRRRGARPALAPHPIPQRQLENCSADTLRALHAVLRDARARRLAHVALGISAFERGGAALYVPAARARDLHATGEVVHVHEPQGSLHVQLTAADARLVYERGHAEPDSLARLRGATSAARVWMFVYFPRCEQELQAVARIVGAALDAACRP